MFAQLIATVAVGLCSLLAVNLLRNYRRAREIGLPILITPIPYHSALWQLSESFLVPLLQSLPFGISRVVHYSRRGWQYDDKYRLHAKHGAAFTVVSPDITEVFLADAGAAEEIFSRRKDFIKAHSNYGALEIFGRNVDTVNGEVWQRHRRITTPPFNERNSSLVWEESRRQASDMLKIWSQKGRNGVPRMDKDLMTLALHVLCRAGFGQSYSFGGGVSNPSEGHTMSYRDALKGILDNIIIVFTIVPIPLPSLMQSERVSMVKRAFVEFKQYMVEMVEVERSSTRSSDRDNLMSALFRASEAEAESGHGRNGLTDEEIFGNLFIYNLAGHDTTAMTAAYATALLSSDDRWQSWIGEEIASVMGSGESEKSGEYENAFPQLKRCLAVMYETLRLYGPVLYTPRYIETESHILSIEGKKHSLPPNTHVIVSQAALHTRPEYWGSDALVWRPDRWIVSNSQGGLEEEEVISPPPGTFLPWISGPRVCPGKKFAQVEFVAVMASLFRKHRARPLLLEGETPEDANKRVRREVDDSSLKITLSINHPEKFDLIWEELS